MGELPSINIVHAIACDDIRQEMNGKFILIGVYGGNMGLPFFPTQIPLAFWMSAEPSKEGDYHIQFRITAPGANPMTLQGQMTLHIEENTALVLPPMPVAVGTPGDITLEYREGDRPWRQICRLQARLVPSPTPPA